MLEPGGTQAWSHLTEQPQRKREHGAAARGVQGRAQGIYPAQIPSKDCSCHLNSREQQAGGSSRPGSAGHQLFATTSALCLDHHGNPRRGEARAVLGHALVQQRGDLGGRAASPEPSMPGRLLGEVMTALVEMPTCSLLSRNKTS